MPIAHLHFSQSLNSAVQGDLLQEASFLTGRCPGAGQTQAGNVIISPASLTLRLIPLISGNVIVDAQLTLPEALLSARGILPVTATAAIHATASGPGLAGGIVSQPAELFVRLADSFGNPAVCS